MDELSLTFQSFIAFLGVSTFAFLMTLGGRSQNELGPFRIIPNRFWGRWIAPSFLGLFLVILSRLNNDFHLWHILVAILILKTATHVGHGGKTFPRKILRRTTKAFIWCSSAIPLALIHHDWAILATQFLIGTFISVVWGIRNPRPAPIEEFFIYFSMSYCLPFFVIGRGV